MATPNPNTNCAQCNYLNGFSLIELMIANALALFVVASVIAIYLNTKQTYQTQQYLARLQENGRFAAHFLRSNIHKAGISSCDENPFISNSIQVYSGVNVPEYLRDQAKANTHILTIKQCTLVDQKEVFAWVAYFIGEIKNSERNTFALFQKVQGSIRKELVSDINDMQIQLGIQCSDKKNICQYVTYDQVNEWQKVGSVEIKLVLNSELQSDGKPWFVYVALQAVEESH